MRTYDGDILLMIVLQEMMHLGWGKGQQQMDLEHQPQAMRLARRMLLVVRLLQTHLISQQIKARISFSNYFQLIVYNNNY